MTGRAIPRTEPLRYGPTAVGLAYRWATVVASLLVALFDPSTLGEERNALLLPVAATAVVSAICLRHGQSRWLPAVLGAEVALAAVAIWLTGYGSSPLLRLYLTAPLVHAALMRDTWAVAGLWILAVSLYVGVMVVHPEGFSLSVSRVIRDFAVLSIVPALVLAVATGRPGVAPKSRLGEQDLAIARQLAQGRTYRQIGDDLDISPETVKVHVARLYRRVGASSRAEAVAAIRELGLLEIHRLPQPHASRHPIREA